jgi:hypothetical protein
VVEVLKRAVMCRQKLLNDVASYVNGRKLACFQAMHFCNFELKHFCVMFPFEQRVVLPTQRAMLALLEDDVLSTIAQLTPPNVTTMDVLRGDRFLGRFLIDHPLLWEADDVTLLRNPQWGTRELTEALKAAAETWADFADPIGQRLRECVEANESAYTALGKHVCYCCFTDQGHHVFGGIDLNASELGLGQFHARARRIGDPHALCLRGRAKVQTGVA